MALSPTLAVMERALEKAARSLIRDFNEVEKLQISVKGPGDFVSKADKRSEQIVVESLQKDRPDWGIFAEEGSSAKGKDERYRFIIDPLDGTTNFLHGIPHWCLTVALEKDSEIIAGMTFDPIRNEIFRAEKGAGAFMNNTRLRVSGRKDLSMAVIGMAGGAIKTDEQLQNFGNRFLKAFDVCANVLTTASLALDMAYVAAGRLDALYATGGYPWDYAAGLLMVKEAAGAATDHTFQPASINKPEFLVGNSAMHKALAELLGLKTVR